MKKTDNNNTTREPTRTPYKTAQNYPPAIGEGIGASMPEYEGDVLSFGAGYSGEHIVKGYGGAVPSRTEMQMRSKSIKSGQDN